MYTTDINLGNPVTRSVDPAMETTGRNLGFHLSVFILCHGMSPGACHGGFCPLRRGPPQSVPFLLVRDSLLHLVDSPSIHGGYDVS